MRTNLPCDSLLEAMLADSDEALVCFQFNGTVILWNAAAERLYGFSEEDILDKHLSLILPVYELPAFGELLRNPLVLESLDPETTERRHKDGSCVRVRMKRVLVRTQQGDVLGILEKTRAFRSRSLIQKAEHHLSLLVEQMPVVFWTTDRRLLITSHWGSGLRLQRSAAAKPIGKGIHEYLRCQQNEDTLVKQHLDALLGISSRFEFKRRNRVFDISIEPLRDSGGAIIGCIGVALDITERKKTEEEIRYQATHDGLTGLANYRDFLERLEREVLRASRSQRSFGLLLLDLDDLKGINDRLGHLAGNRALKRLARVMKENCRATDVAARYGGDEFAVILLDSDSRMVEFVAKRVENCLRLQTDLPLLSVSIGCAVYPLDGLSAQDLLEAADKHLYRNKKSARLLPLPLRQEPAVSRLS